MANEISIGIAESVTNGELRHSMPLTTDLIDQTTKALLSKVESVPTTAGGTVISTTGITALGYLYVKNLDATNFVKYGPTSAGAIVDFGKLKPGEQAILRLMPGISLRFISDTAACLVGFVFYDD